MLLRLVRWLLWRLFWLGLSLLVLLPGGLIGLYAVVPPPVTPLMLIRWTEGQSIGKDWVPLDQMSQHLPAAVIAAEDNLFCRHHGFDVDAIREQVDNYLAGERVRGASGITQQTAKNLFLWPNRGWFGKALEAWLSLGLEVAWPKRRILEVYLNVIEFGPGVYGAEAASLHHFRKGAEKLTRRQAALLASVLPAPLVRSASQPSAGVVRKARIVEQRIGQIGNLLDCY